MGGEAKSSRSFSNRFTRRFATLREQKERGTHSGAQKSESSQFFVQFLAFVLFRSYFFSIYHFSFIILPIMHVQKCSMHFIIGQYFACPPFSLNIVLILPDMESTGFFMTSVYGV